MVQNCVSHEPKLLRGLITALPERKRYFFDTHSSFLFMETSMVVLAIPLQLAKLLPLGNRSSMSLASWECSTLCKTCSFAVLIPNCNVAKKIVDRTCVVSSEEKESLSVLYLLPHDLISS